MSKKKETVRVQMELAPLSIDRLKYLKEKTEASSYAEVTKNSYRLYEMIIKLQESGNSFLVKEPSGNTQELHLFL